MKVYVCDKCGEVLIERNGILICSDCYTEYNDIDGLSYEVIT